MPKVIVIGATGNLGPVVVRGLLDHGHSVTALCRAESTSVAPHGIPFLKADYTSLESLKAAFKGYDAVVSALGDVLNPSSIPTQKLIVDAAIAAGVNRFIPSEFGSDDVSERSEEVPVYHAKQVARKYLEEKAAEGKIEYTTIINGPFAEWMLGRGLGGFDPKGKKVELFDDSSLPFPTTHLPAIGNAVGVALKKWDDTRNKVIMIRGLYFSQDEVLQVFEELTGGEKWEVKKSKTEEELKRGLEGLQKDPTDWVGGLLPALRGVIYSRYYNHFFDDEERIKRDNELLEVKPLDKDGLKAFVKGLLEQ